MTHAAATLDSAFASLLAEAPSAIPQLFAQRTMALRHSASSAAPARSATTAPGSAPPTQAQFLEFHRITQPPLAAYVQQSSGNADVTEDVVQEAYLRFLRSRTATTDLGHARAYLFRIATNLLRDRHRRRDLEFPVQQDDSLLGAPHPAGSPQTHAFGKEVRRLLLRLSERDRQLLWLAHVEQMSHREMAQVLGLREVSIRPMLFRAKVRFKALLERAGVHSAAQQRQGAKR